MTGNKILAILFNQKNRIILRRSIHLAIDSRPIGAASSPCEAFTVSEAAFRRGVTKLYGFSFRRVVTVLISPGAIASAL